MPQITAGHILGVAPGQTPGVAAPVMDLLGSVPPSASTDPNVSGCANGSTYRNVNGGSNTTLYVKVSGAWVAIA